MVLQDVFEELDLKGSYDEQCKQYAEMLDTGYIPGVIPEELDGDEYSSNGIWSWSKRDGFIGKYKNNVNFQEVLCLFEKPLADGVFVITAHSDYSFTERERIVARIAKKVFVDVRVNFDNNRIFSATELTRRQVDREINQFIIRSSVKLYKPFLDMYEAEDGKAVISGTKCKILPLLRMYANFVNDVHSREDSLMSLVHGLDFSAEEANWFLDEWKRDKDIAKKIQNGEIDTDGHSYTARFCFNNDHSSIIFSEWFNEFSKYDIYFGNKVTNKSSYSPYSEQPLDFGSWGAVKVIDGKVIISVGNNCPDNAIELVIKKFGLEKYKELIVTERR